MDTAQQVAATTGSSATGSAYLSLNTTFDTLWYNLQGEGLSGAITGAHIHNAAVGVDGGVLIDISANISGSSISGMATGSDITPALIQALLTGETYFNLHTAANAPGELRGQIYRLAREGYTFTLDGIQEVPTDYTVATGSGLVSMDRGQTGVHFMMVMSDLTGPLTGIHFHKAVKGSNGGVVYDLTPLTSGVSSDDAAFGYWTDSSASPFTAMNAMQFIGDSIYVNAHTADKPAGELRGQVWRGFNCYKHWMADNGMRPKDPMFSHNILFSSKLTGDQFTPVVITNAAGVGGFLLNATRDTIWVNINVDSISGPITAIHIHEGAVGITGPVVTDLSSMVTGNKISGFLVGFDLNKFVTESYYINLHTTANPNGELRGQISLEEDWSFTADIMGSQLVPAVPVAQLC